MKKTILNYIIGALIIAGGVFCFINPTGAIRDLLKYTGILFVIIGTVKIIYSSINKDAFTIGSCGLIGIFFFIVGLILITTNFLTINFLSMLISIYLIGTGLSALIYCFKAKSYLNSYFIGNLFKLIFGIALLIAPMINVVITGIGLGIVLVIFGLSFFVKPKNDSKVYSVKVKKR